MNFIYSFFIIIIFFIFLFELIESKKEITIGDKKKVRACLMLQQKKFNENEGLMNEFIKNKSEIYKRTPNKIVLLSLAYCYDKISFETANKIVKSKRLNIMELDIKDIYDFENYNYDDQERNKIVYDNFFPIFQEVFEELSENEERKNPKDKFYVYFIHTKLFKFFTLYTIINCVIVFYIRFKNHPKNIDKDNKFDVEDNYKNTKNNDEEEINGKEKEDNNLRRLKKKNRLGKKNKIN